MKIYEKYSYREYLDRALNGKSCRARESRVSSDGSWFGTPDWDTAAKLAGEGWNEGRELVGSIVRELEGSMRFDKPGIQWDVEGDMIDIGAFVSGQSENMMKWGEPMHAKRVARILHNVSTGGAVSAEVMRWKGACTLALIEKLETEGVRVELDLADTCYSKHGDTAAFVVSLKEYGEPLHLDLLAFHLTHPSSQRRIFFSFEETCSPPVVEAFRFYQGGGYSNPADIKRLLPEGETYDLIIPEMHLNKLSDAIAEVEKMFATVCGIEEKTY